MKGGGLDWIEAATHLLRRLPAVSWASYYVGSLVFITAVLFYWSDMSHNAYAWQGLTAESAGVAFAYLWMKWWQSVFAGDLRHALEGGEPRPWTARRIRRMMLFQMAVQPSGLFAIPAGMLAAIPFATIMGFYQGFSVTGDGEGELRGVISRTLKLAGLWNRQSWSSLSILLAFGLFVFLNLVVAMLFLPELARMYLGIDSAFTRAGANVIGSTLFAVCFGLTYLALDPLLKALAALRCFHGESIHSGADLRAEVRREMREMSRTMGRGALAAMAICLLLHRPAEAQQGAQKGMDTERLDRTITEVLQERQYAWRLPRQRPDIADADKNPFIRFTEGVMRKIGEGTKRLGEAIRWLIEKWSRNEAKIEKPFGTPTAASFLQFWLWVLAGAVTVAAAVLWWRFGRRPARQADAVAIPMAAAVDLNAEDLSADQLPEDGWRALASEWIAKGDLRMAMRALFLATLAHLGERERIRVNAGKSNREYLRELRRKARGAEGLLPPFEANLFSFEVAWYGGRPVDRGAYDVFAANAERIRAHG